jgi:hypothetical protein
MQQAAFAVFNDRCQRSLYVAEWGLVLHGQRKEVGAGKEAREWRRRERKIGCISGVAIITVCIVQRCDVFA